MATISNNKKGNPYHDEETGEFTSAGISAVRDVIEKPVELNPKVQDFLNSLGGIPGGSMNAKVKAYINSSSPKQISFLVDDFISVPYFIHNYGAALCQRLKQSAVVNTDRDLDYVGIDLIGFERGEFDIKTCNFIDIKTGYAGGININIAQMIGDGRLVADGLLNPHYKANNLFAVQFIDDMPTNKKELAATMLNPNTFAPRDFNHPTSAYLVDKEDLYNAIYESVPRENFQEAFDLLRGKLRSGVPLNVAFKSVFSGDTDAVFTEHGGGIGNVTLDLGGGLKFGASFKGDRTFKMFIRADKSFFESIFLDNKL